MDPRQDKRAVERRAAEAAVDRAEAAVDEIYASVDKAYRAIDTERRFDQVFSAAVVIICVMIWVAFLLWEDWRNHLIQEGLWWMPIAATILLACVAFIARYSRSATPPPPH